MSNYIIVAETGSDVPIDLAERFQITYVPMHVSFGGNLKDDMTFPIEELYAFYKSTGTLPQSVGCNPVDFETVFDSLHQQHPDKHILHIAYSAATSCSFQSAHIAAEGRDYVTSIDTKHCSAGQAMVVIAMAHFVQEHPDCTLAEVHAEADRLINTVRMGFFPGDLDYLRAGGRVTNAAYMGAKLLSLNPLIEFEDGSLVATQKYRGSMKSIAPKLIAQFSEKHRLQKEVVALVYSAGLEESIKELAVQTARDCGFKKIIWIRTGGVISTHSGPGGFGLVGFSEE